MAKLCLENRRNKKQDAEALQITTELLDSNPENYLYWNIRREIFIEGIFPQLATQQEPKSESESKSESKSNSNEDSDSIIQNQNKKNAAIALKQKYLLNDIQFVLAKLKQFPKTYWLWNHRSWCINEFPGADWNQELQLVDYLLSKDPRNFHGWHYRRVVVDKLNKLQQYKPSGGKDTETSLVKHEFQFTTQKINNNFSNFSAWYNRALLIPSYLLTLEQEQEQKHDKESNDDINTTSSEIRKKFLVGEIDYVRQALYTDPDVSSAWFYHKWLYSNMRKSIYPDLSPSQFIKYLQEEIQLVEELSEVEPNNSYCLLGLVYLRDHLREENKKLLGSDNQEKNGGEDEDEGQRTIEVYEQLTKIDPLRKNMYMDWKSKYEAEKIK